MYCVVLYVILLHDLYCLLCISLLSLVLDIVFGIIFTKELVYFFVFFIKDDIVMDDTFDFVPSSCSSD